MTGLGNFLPEDQDLLIGIFYRVGFWISHIDDTDETEHSEEREKQQLIRALEKIASSKGTTALIRELASEATRRSGDQARWLTGSDRLLSDVTHAATLVRGQGTEDDYRVFCKSVMFAATAVARAYREEPEHGEKTGRFAGLLERAGSFLGALGDKEGYKDLSISPAEDSALTELSAALSFR